MAGMGRRGAALVLMLSGGGRCSNGGGGTDRAMREVLPAGSRARPLAFASRMSSSPAWTVAP